MWIVGCQNATDTDCYKKGVDRLSIKQHISQEDLTLYSKQALTSAQNVEVQTHLDTCVSCRRALADLLSDVSLIGQSGTQQVFPKDAQKPLEGIENPPQPSAATVAPVGSSLPTRVRQRTGFGWFGWVTTFAALAVALYFSHHSFVLLHELDGSRTQIAQLSAQVERSQELMDALTSPDAKKVTLTETQRPAQPVGHVTYLPKSGTLIFVVSELRPLPRNKTYELWLIPANGKAPIPAGLFRPDASGSSSVVEPPLPEGVEAKAFGVTVEEAAGSATPTLPIVMAGQ
jgi:hypothetical protein